MYQSVRYSCILNLYFFLLLVQQLSESTLKSLCQTISYKVVWVVIPLSWGQAKCQLYGLARCISGDLFVRKSMEMVFWTKQSVCIIVDSCISEVSARRGSTIYSKFQFPRVPNLKCILTLSMVCTYQQRVCRVCKLFE